MSDNEILFIAAVRYCQVKKRWLKAKYGLDVPLWVLVLEFLVSDEDMQDPINVSSTIRIQ